jgi:TM2 domain-containing membrane protein YozV
MSRTTPPADAHPPARWHFNAAVATWLIPGCGHLLIGQTRRGLIIMFAIAWLWIIGLLIGGVSSIDRTEHPAWFLGQMLIAPSVAVNYYHQSLRLQQVGQPVNTSGQVIYEPSLGRINEQGVLYTSLAGLLNLLAIIDVLYHEPRRRPAVVGAA